MDGTTQTITTSFPTKTASSRRFTLPAYRERKGYDQAIVTLTDAATGKRRDYRPGPFGSSESREAYLRLIAAWESNQRRLPDKAKDAPTRPSGSATALQVTVNEVIRAYWHWAKAYYQPTESATLKVGLRLLRQYYGASRAVDFGPTKWRLLGDAMIRGDENADPPRMPWSRGYINAHVRRIRSMFRWAASHELLLVSVHQGLATVEPLKRGRTTAREGKKVLPAGQDPLRRRRAVEQVSGRGAWGVGRGAWGVGGGGGAGGTTIAPMDLTREQYEAECGCRFGIANPERMNVTTWEWMLRKGFTASGGSHHFLKEWFPPDSDAPRWCFTRNGMSQTVMPDGRIICIGGEHEDSYDPDFQIYNDVVVLRPAPGETDISETTGDIEMYGYSESAFPPTDFHAAVLVGERIFIIGCLGYMDARVPGTTPVYVLDTTTYRIEPLKTHGSCPGWIYEHHAAYEAETNSIVVRGGRVVGPDDGADSFNPTFNSTVFRLRLADLTWEIATPHEATRRVLFSAGEDWSGHLRPSSRTFRPRNVAHLHIRSDRGDPYNGPSMDYRIDVDGIRVTFRRSVTEVRVTIEGELSPTTERQLIADIIDNLEQETGVPWMSEYVEEFR